MRSHIPSPPTLPLANFNPSRAARGANAQLAFSRLAGPNRRLLPRSGTCLEHVTRSRQQGGERGRGLWRCQNSEHWPGDEEKSGEFGAALAVLWETLLGTGPLGGSGRC